MKLVVVMVVACVIACRGGDKQAPPPPVPAPAASPPTDTALAAYNNKQWATCADLYEKQGGMNALYNAACCRAQDGKQDAAFATLDRAIAAGYTDTKHMVDDPDLVSLRDDPRWAKALASIDEKIAAYEKTLKDPALRKEILALMDEDQAARKAYIATKDPKAQERIKASDAKTTARMKEVVAKYGWPGKSIIGEDGTRAAWLLVQHADEAADLQKLCLPLLEKAVAAGESPKENYAYLYDRVAVHDGRPQRYGTQFANGVPDPIEDEAHVDERRKEVGLGSMAAYREQMRKMYGSDIK